MRDLKRLEGMASTTRISARLNRLELCLSVSSLKSSSVSRTTASPLSILSDVLARLTKLETLVIDCRYSSPDVLLHALSPSSSSSIQNAVASTESTFTSPKSSALHLKRMLVADAPIAHVNTALDVFSSVGTLELNLTHPFNSAVSPTFMKHVVHDFRLTTNTALNSFSQKEMAGLIELSTLSRLAMTMLRHPSTQTPLVSSSARTSLTSSSPVAPEREAQ